MGTGQRRRPRDLPEREVAWRSLDEVSRRRTDALRQIARLKRHRTQAFVCSLIYLCNCIFSYECANRYLYGISSNITAENCFKSFAEKGWRKVTYYILITRPNEKNAISIFASPSRTLTHSPFQDPKTGYYTYKLNQKRFSFAVKHLPNSRPKSNLILASGEVDQSGSSIPLERVLQSVPSN